MITQFDRAKWMQDGDGVWLMLRVKFPSVIKKFIESMKDKLYVVDIKEYREKRSLNANAYMWLLLEEMAALMNASKDEVYLVMLERYGVFTHIVVKTAAKDMFMREYKLCKDLGEITVNGTTGHQFQVYFGSSTYDTKQMARLLDGIVSECKEMDIETRTPEELSRLKSEWGV